LLVPLVAILAGCGGTTTYSAEKSRACLLAFFLARFFAEEEGARLQPVTRK